MNELVNKIQKYLLFLNIYDSNIVISFLSKQHLHLLKKSIKLMLLINTSFQL